jgi:hypothetical protein
MFVDRQVDALRETFPKVVGALGEEPFQAIAAKYVHEHPSENPDLGQIGRHFACRLPKRDLQTGRRASSMRAMERNVHRTRSARRPPRGAPHPH